jgi:hypothetical protein
MPIHRSHSFGRSAHVAVLLIAAWLAPVAADTVVLRNGDQLEGTVVLVDDRQVTVRGEGGNRNVPREQVQAIHFSGAAPLPPLKIELRSLGADDSIEVLLEDEVVFSAGHEQGGWTDLTPALKDGNNELRLRIHNERGTWAYRLSLRINGRATQLACGTPRKLDKPCTCCGMKGWERGVIEGLEPIWLFVDRKAGTAEVLP